MDQTTIIKRPIISEKSMSEAKNLKYCFEVDLHADKNTIKRAIEKKFGVHVISVSSLVMKGRKKRVGKKRAEISLPVFKKAMVQVKTGEKIGLFEEGAKE